MYDPTDKRIGTIHHLIIEKVSGQVVYVVMSFGGFLGMRMNTHTIPWDKLNYDIKLGGNRTDITQEHLRDVPVAIGDERIWQDRRREKDIHDHGDVPPSGAFGSSAAPSLAIPLAGIGRSTGPSRKGGRTALSDYICTE